MIYMTKSVRAMLVKGTLQISIISLKTKQKKQNMDFSCCILKSQGFGRYLAQRSVELSSAEPQECAYETGPYGTDGMLPRHMGSAYASSIQ